MNPVSHMLYTAAQSRELDAQAIATLDVSGFELMQRAAATALAVLRERWPLARRIGVVCGPGNNGGDGFVLAALAHAQGLDVQVVALSGHSRGDAALAREACVNAGVQPRLADAQVDLPPADVYVDGLFGSGLSRAPEGAARQLIEGLNASASPVLALDVPSGIDSDTGARLECAVRAEVTVCFIAWKRGLFTGQAVDYCGDLHLRTLDLPESLCAQHAPDARLLQAQGLPPREHDSNKGKYGHVLVIGGDEGFAGAARMVSEAALRIGAGLVSVATRGAHAGGLLSARPELMVRAVDDPDALSPMLKKVSVLALGAGLGQEDWGRALWRQAVDCDLPLLLDADGLNLLSKQPRDFADRDVILTPHPGEAARLLDCSIADIQSDRFAAVRALTKRYAAVAVLKGAGSLIADPEGRVALCRWGNPGMASGGMGDVLGGVIAGLLAQGQTPWEAACLGVGLHARAGDLAARAGQRGLLASDLFAPLRQLVNADAED